MKPVKVTSKDGVVVIESTNNPEYGYVRLEQEAVNMENGWIRKQNRSAFIRGTVEDLKAMAFREGQTLPGKIVIVEATSSDNPRAQAKINPQTGEELTHSGQPIYRDAVYTTDLSRGDVLLQHDVVNVGYAQRQEADMEIAK